MREVGAEIQPIFWACIFLEEGEPFSHHKGTFPKELYGPFSKAHEGLVWVSEGPGLRNLRPEYKRGKGKQQDFLLLLAPQQFSLYCFHL